MNQSYADSIQELVSCGEDPLRRAYAALRKLNENDPQAFAEAGLHLLIHEPACNEHKYLCFLLSVNSGTIKLLTGPELPLSHAAHAARALGRANPEFAALLSGAIRDWGSSVDEPVLARTLHLLDLISTGSPLAGRVSSLLEHPSVRICSKAAIFVGRRTHNLQWAERNLANPDARVRANVVESLWGVDSPEARRLLKTATEDPDNRVTGNALYGLYRIDDAPVVPVLIGMAHHPKAPHRVTAAWVMGETGDRRFLGDLSALVRDPDTAVRNAGFKAIRRVKSAFKKCEQAGHLTVRTLPAASRDGIAFQVPFVVLDGHARPVRNLRHTQIAPYVDGRLVTAYTVTESAAPDFVRNVVCVVGGAGEKEIRTRIVKRLHDFLTASRVRESWRVYVANEDHRDSPAVRFVWQNQIESSAMLTGPDGQTGLSIAGAVPPVPPDETAVAIHDLLATLTRRAGKRHLIAVRGAEIMSAAEWRMLTGEAVDGKIAVDSVVAGDEPSNAILREAASLTGGLCLRAGTVEELVPAVDVLCESLQHRYYLSLGLPDGVDPAEVGCALAGELKIASAAGCGEAAFQLPRILAAA